MESTQAQLRLLHHTLGISDPAKCDRAPYRNYFVASPGHQDYADLTALVEQGLMERFNNRIDDDSVVFAATDAGRELALQTRPRLSRDELLNRRFLEAKDLCPDLTFDQYIAGLNNVDVTSAMGVGK